MFWRIALVNTAGSFLVAAAAYAGWLAPVFWHDQSYLSWLIAAVLAVTLVDMMRRSWLIAGDHDSTVRLQDDYLEWPRYLVEGLPMLGLIGCVIGFSIVSRSAAIGGDADSAAKAAQAILNGIGTATGPTLVGCTAWAWTSLILRMLEDQIEASYRRFHGML